MVTVEIEIPNKSATAFQEAVKAYNTKQDPPTSYTQKQVLRRLLRNFTIDTIRAKRIKIAQDAADEEVAEL